ncbi:MAG: hypothetical protein HS117_17925 [Verrucomicrobiaceae bacterium]|jgi:hypothetical protein|nr:hypothetical protein [Verrucomicrobiaceae bacterium]
MKLKNMNSIMAKSVAVLAACAALNANAGTAPAPAPAPEEPSSLFDSVGAELSAAYDSRYYFRGLWFADNIVSTFLNLSVPLMGGGQEDGGSLTWGIGAGYISTADTPFIPTANNPVDGDFDYSEIDIYTSLTYDVGWAKFGMQYQYYFYPDTYGGSNSGLANGGTDPEFGIKGNSELGFTVGIPIGALNLGFGYFHDFTVGGHYFQASADYTIAVTDWMSIVPAIQTGYGIDYYTGNNTAVLTNLNGQAASNFGGGTFPTSGFTHLLVSVSAPIKVTKSATFVPYIAWNHSLDLRSSLNLTTHNEVYWGAKVAISF